MTVAALPTEQNSLHAQLIREIAAQLAEPDPGAVAQIRGVVSILGPERTAVLVRAVVRLEQLGGCLIANGSRRRTACGLFLVLSRGCLSQAQRAAIWPEYRRENAETPLTATGAFPVSLSGTNGTGTGTGVLSDQPNIDHDSTPVAQLQQEGYHDPGPFHVLTFGHKRGGPT